MLTWCCEDFSSRKLKAPLVLAWLVLQAGGIIFQLSLLFETSQHLEEYEATLAANCGPAQLREGVCLGPAWNLSFSGMLTFPPVEGQDNQADFDFVIPTDQVFAFRTLSAPPTFLIGVEPQEPNVKARWTMSVSPAPPGVGEPLATFDWGVTHTKPLTGLGSKYVVFVEKGYRGNGAWSGSMTLRSKFSTTSQVHVYVVDSRIAHLEDVHAQPQCSFEQSWQNFSERHNGEHHRVLTFAWWATASFLAVSVLSASAILHRFYFYVEGGKLLSRVIAAKLVLQDFPQQMCIIVYLYGWYAHGGLRCQMCLFHPKHCDDEHPLHRANLLVCLFTLLSATANQLLLRAKNRSYDEEELCSQWFARSAMCSVSVLPFSTAILVLSHALLHLRSVSLYFLAAIPTVIGWGTVLCIPMVALCEDEMLV